MFNEEDKPKDRVAAAGIEIFYSNVEKQILTVWTI